MRWWAICSSELWGLQDSQNCGKRHVCLPSQWNTPSLVWYLLGNQSLLCWFTLLENVLPFEDDLGGKKCYWVWGAVVYFFISFYTHAIFSHGSNVLRRALSITTSIQQYLNFWPYTDGSMLLRYQKCFNTQPNIILTEVRFDNCFTISMRLELQIPWKTVLQCF